MKARILIEANAHSPEALVVLGKAFDDAWSEIADKFNGDARAIEEARLQLAQAVLAVSEAESADPNEVKAAALQAMLSSQP